MGKDTHATRRDVVGSVVEQQWRGVRVAEDMHIVAKSCKFISRAKNTMKQRIILAPPAQLRLPLPKPF